MKKLIALNVILVVTTMVYAQVPATLENLTLAAESYWDGEDNWDGVYPTAIGEEKIYDDAFTSGDFSFNNQFVAGYYDWGGGYIMGSTSWSGFAYSNMTDTTTAGFGNQYSVCTGTAASGENFAVAYFNSRVIPTITQNQAGIVDSLLMTNTTYTYLSMRDGDFFAEPLDEGDWFKVTITGKDELGDVTGTLDVYLADYRDGKTILVDSWMTVDLTSLGAVKTMEFASSAWNASLNEGAGGYDYNWPSYAAIDNVPEPASMILLGLGSVALLRRRRK